MRIRWFSTNWKPRAAVSICRIRLLKPSIRGSVRRLRKGFSNPSRWLDYGGASFAN